MRARGAILFALFLLAVSGCAPQGSAPLKGRSLEDGTGAGVTIPVSPRRIVSLAPSLTETLFDLGAGDSVVGVSDSCDRPDRVRSLPRVGPIVQPSIEAILALKPDLVLATADGNPLQTLERLRSLGIPVFGVASRATGLAAVSLNLLAVARAAGREQEGVALVAALESDVRAVKERARDQIRLGGCCLVWMDPPIAAGRDSFLHDIVTAAGLDDRCVEDREGSYPRLSREDLLVAQPAVLLLATGDAAPPPLGDWAAAIPAVRAGRVLILEDRFVRPTVGLGAAAEDLRARLAKLSVAPQGG